MTGTGTAEKTNQANEQKIEEKSPEATQGLDEKKGGVETQQERTYSQSEVDALLGRAGQRIQTKLEAVTAERNSFKTQAETLTSQITKANEKVDSLTKDIDAMSEDEPDKHKLVQRRKEWETKLSSLETRETELENDRKEVSQWKRDQLVYNVADEYKTATGENIDMDSFKKSADRFKLSESEDLEAFAESLGYKRKDEIPQKDETPPPPKPFAAKTAGGSDRLGDLPPSERVKAVEAKIPK